ncbi:DNA/RNA helicase domain-containing protein [Melittangium boletus]|uniref:DNA/RNA helicase domain-containing protein n=1 Tax=Melittangium boletus TaxID=83453 RepID=UPI003DA20539
MDAGTLPGLLKKRFEAIEGEAPSSGEQQSWKNSLRALAEVLRDERLCRSEIFVELWMPMGGRRCDAVLTGREPEGAPAAVVVELKQWTSVGKSPWREEVVVMNDSRRHPSAQVKGYVDYLRYYHSAFVQDGVHITGCVWLHAMEDVRAIALLRDPDAFGDLAREYPLFMKREQGRFAQWLQEQLGHGEGTRAAHLIATGRPRPSEKLLDMVVQTIHGEFEWRLLDVQRQAYLRIITAVEEGRAHGTRTVVLIKGGPGTGKSVLALQLLAHGARKSWRVIHATGSQAFQTNLQGKTLAFAANLHKQLQGARFKKELPVDELFCTFSEVAKAGARQGQVLDLTVADEAHRLWEFRRLKFPNGTIRHLSDTPMIEEVISASHVTAFFLDDNQAVRAGEIGHSDVVREAVKRMGVRLVELELDIQFRCGGSDGYVQWVDMLLGFSPQADLSWKTRGEYEVTVETDMARMDRRLRTLQHQNYRCRIVAGYCWSWSPVGTGATWLVHDVKDKRFGDWSAPWIEKTGQGRKPLDHQYYRWANEDAYYEQVGSIYSVQGFEFDHVGVIWGEDLVWRTDRWVADLSKNKDKTFKRDVRTSEAEALAKLRNVYRVLLTRGTRGTHVFILDAETRAHVESLLRVGLARQLA